MFSSSGAHPKLQGLRGCWVMAEASINFLGTGRWGRLHLVCPGSWISLAIGELMCRQWHYSLTAIWFPRENNMNCSEYYRKGGSRKWNLVIPIVISEWSRSVMSNSLQPHGLYVAHQAPPSMEFSKQEYWSVLPFPSPGDLSNLGIEPSSPALRADALTSEPPAISNKGKRWTGWWLLFALVKQQSWNVRAEIQTSCNSGELFAPELER